MAEEDPRKQAAGTARKGNLRSSGKLNREIQAQLGNQLRQMYNDLVEEGVPDKFVNLLARLEREDGGEDGGKSGGSPK